MRMNKLHLIAVGAAVVMIAGGRESLMFAMDREADPPHDSVKLSVNSRSPAGDGPSAESKETGGDKKPNMGPEDFKIEEKEDRRLEKELEKEKREYKSIKKDTLSFHLGFSIGGIGYGVVGGALNASRNLYKFRYQKGAFQFGFRGGIEAMFFVNRANSLSLGIFYEQREAELKINYIPLTRIVLPPVDPPILLVYLPVFRYIPRSVVDLNTLNFPVMYRYYVLDEFYIGIGVDVAWVFQAHAGFNFTLIGSSTNLRKRLSPVDIGGKLAFGVTINRVFIELGVGAGVLRFDRMNGDRHSIYLTAMIGYRV